MKKSEIAMIILVASVAVMVAWLVASRMSFLKVDPEGEKVQTIDSISSTLSGEPDPNIFNKKAINPTVITIIGDDKSGN